MSKKSKISTEPYKGVRDFYPEDQAFLNFLFATWRRVAESYGYVEYNASTLEPAELYKSKGAENEEITNQQTYTFIDRGEREVTLRPEMTPTVARMVAGKRRELGYPLRWYSIPNCFRYERPQRGRLREFWQFNADLFGSRSMGADAEMIAFAASLVKAFGGSDADFVIKIGSRSYVDQVVAELGLDEARGKSLLMLLDRRGKMAAREFDMALGELGVPPSRLLGEPPAEIVALIALLKTLGVTNAEFDPSIVRGFNYYTGIVFEVFDTHPDNNRAMFGGGRYDNLTELFDDDPIPGIGFAMGDVTMRDFLAVRGLLPAYVPPTKVYVAIASDNALVPALSLAEELRAAGVPTAADFGERRLGDQIKAASKHRIPYLLVVGDEEVSTEVFTVRNLETGAEEKIDRAQLSAFFLNLTV
jgi:histidyl-tRNA synthetase